MMHQPSIKPSMFEIHFVHHGSLCVYSGVDSQSQHAVIR